MAATIRENILTRPPRILGDIDSTMPRTPATTATTARRKPAPGDTAKLAIADTRAIRDGILKCALVVCNVSMERTVSLVTESNTGAFTPLVMLENCPPAEALAKAGAKAGAKVGNLFHAN